MLKKMINKGKAAIAVVTGTLSVLATGTASAVLPTAVTPSTAPAAGDWLSYVEGYAKDGGTALGLILGMVGFIWVSWALIAKFNEARSGKAEWGEVGLLVVIGGVILVFMVYMLTQSASII